jgi:hypothetical protein
MSGRNPLDGVPQRREDADLGCAHTEFERGAVHAEDAEGQYGTIAAHRCRHCFSLKLKPRRAW